MGSASSLWRRETHSPAAGMHQEFPGGVHREMPGSGACAAREIPGTCVDVHPCTGSPGGQGYAHGDMELGIFSEMHWAAGLHPACICAQMPRLFHGKSHASKAPGRRWPCSSICSCQGSSRSASLRCNLQVTSCQAQLGWKLKASQGLFLQP